MLVKVGDTTAEVRVEACLSMPRVGFNDNWANWVQALMPLGIRPTRFAGAFWNQGLQRCFEEFVDKCEYILAIDFDSFFCQTDVEHLMTLAMAFQCDALTGLQVKRDDGRPMFTMLGTIDDPPADGKTTVPMEWFGQPVQQVDTAHFGCTVISTAALKRTPKPWFQGVANADGEWKEGRIDDDQWFWRQFKKAGNKAYITPRVILGHGEYMVTWPGAGLGPPVHQYATEYTQKLTPPKGVWKAGE